MRAPPASAAAVLVILLASALGAQTVASSADTDRAPVSGDHRVGEFALAQDPTDPGHFIALGYDLDSSSGAAYCTAFVTRDGGHSWTMVELPPGDHGDWTGDPWIAIGPDGIAHATCITVSTIAGTTTYFYNSADGGLTWGAASSIARLVDKDALLVTKAGDLLVCGSFSNPSGLAIARSRDGGSTWTQLAQFPSLKNCNGMAEGPGGAIHLTWLAIEGQQRVVGLLSSADGGATWGPPIEVARHPYPNDETDPQTLQHDPDVYTTPADTWPALAVGPATASVFLADTRDDAATNTIGLKLRVSRDAGATFELASLPAIPSALANVTYTRPAVAADASGGVALQVAANGGAGFNEREIWLLISPDDGAHWLAPTRIAATDAMHGRLDPRAHLPNTNSLANEAMYAPTHTGTPDSASNSAVLLANSGQLDWGGDYWSIAPTAGGFLTMWEDFAQGGENRLYAHVVPIDITSP